MSNLRKEFVLIYRNRYFTIIQFIIILLAISFSIGIRAFYHSGNIVQDYIIYFISVYPLFLENLILSIYPVSENIREHMNGGLENLLATPLSLESIILGKSIVLSISIYIPIAFFLIILINQNILLSGLISLIIVQPIFIFGISTIYVTAIMTSPNPTNIIGKGSSIASILLLIFSFVPKLLENIVPGKIFFAISVLVSILTFIYSFKLLKDSNKRIENMILTGGV